MVCNPKTSRRAQQHVWCAVHVLEDSDRQAQAQAQKRKQFDSNQGGINYNLVQKTSHLGLGLFLPARDRNKLGKHNNHHGSTVEAAGEVAVFP